ncbi:methyltransferase [Microbacterium enclense]|uniref:RraA family protein n=1 Tax=Microbacterium enclense TaxID=993073 RepID=UPI0036DEEFF1
MTTSPTPVAADVVTGLAALPVANIGDSMDRLNVVDAGIHAVWRGAAVAGPAFTVEVAGGDNAGIHAAISQVPAGAVLVVNGHGVTDRALIGELIAERLRKVGCVGFVVDGAVRDVGDLEEMGFPVFARSSSPAGPYKNGPFRVGVPIALGGVVVTPGDVVVGDGDGLAVVPAAEAEEVLERARRKNADESEIRRGILAS